MTVKWRSDSGSKIRSSQLHHGYVLMPHVMCRTLLQALLKLSHTLCNRRGAVSIHTVHGYEVVPGKLPAFWDNELMIGMKMPPALAVVEGMAGAIAASANANPYAKPSVLLPKALRKKVATRSPSPIFSKPCRCPGLKLCKPVDAAAVFQLM